MAVRNRDVIEAYAVLILLDGENEPLYMEDIRGELGRNFINNSKLPSAHTLAVLFWHSDYFISIEEYGGDFKKYEISPKIYERLQPHIPELFQLASSPKKLLKKIKKYSS